MVVFHNDRGFGVLGFWGFGVKNNRSFQRHVAAGFISYDKKQVDPSKKAENMALKD